MGFFMFDDEEEEEEEEEGKSLEFIYILLIIKIGGPLSSQARRCRRYIID